MPRHPWAFPVLGLALATALIVAVPGAATAATPAYPPLPIGDRFLTNLSSPTLAPGASGSLAFGLSNPLSTPLAGAALTFQVYAFNAFPGNATSNISVAGAPLLSNATSSGFSVGVSVGTLAAGGSFRGALGVTTSANSPNGAFAVRTSLRFVANGSTYLLESRGWFSAAQWAAATELPNGSATLNLSALGVSGVLPETALVIANSAFPAVLAGLVAAALLLVGVGAWIYFRRESSSRSGTRHGDDDHQAPSALGASRTSDGD